MNNITGNDYVSFLLQVKQVCIESKITPEGGLDLIGPEANDAACRALQNYPSITLESVIAKIKEYGISKLVAYEAASRAELKSLSDAFIKKWAVKFQDKVDEKLSTKITIENFEKKFQKIVTKFHLPSLQNPERAESKMMENVRLNVFKEVIYSKFHENVTQVPQHAMLDLKNITVTEDPYHQHILNKYSSLLKCLDLGSHYSLKRNEIRTYLERFKMLETLDLTGIVVKPNCLKGLEHLKLKKIVVTGTQIDSRAIEIPSKSFPSLVEFIQNKKVKILFMDEIDKLSWEKINGLASSCTDYKNTDKAVYLLKKYQNEPCTEGLQALLTIKDRMQANYKHHYPSFCENMYHTLLSSWLIKPAIEDRSLRYVLSIFRNPEIEEALKDSILLTLVNEISLTKKISVWHNDYRREVEKDIIAHVDAACIHKVRLLLKSLDSESIALFNPAIDRLEARIKETSEKIFFCKSDHEAKDLLQTSAFLHEVYTQLSYSLSFDGNLILENPKKAFRKNKVNDNNPALMFFNLVAYALTSETYFPSPYYQTLMDQKLVCAFTLRMQTIQSREALLNMILEIFSNYKCRQLPRLVLGVPLNEDLPNEGFMRDRLISYGGVFEEDVSQEIKLVYWNALCEGKLGGKAKSLIDAIVAFYSKSSTSDFWKSSCLKALHDLGGVLFEGPLTHISYANPLSSDFQSYARACYDKIKR